MRLDLLLVEKGLFKSRNKAQAAILDNAIYVDDKLANKPSLDINEHSKIEIKKEVCPFVSRGGYKLLEAIKKFNLDFNDKIIVDIGASTGGFTDCALQNNAKKVYAIDVGTNQLDSKIKNDSRVISLENTNILDIKGFDDEIDFFVMDVSFVSIEYLLPGLNNLIKDSKLICLIKPQFELGKSHLKNGVVKDRKLHLKVLNQVNEALNEYNLGIKKLIPSPILGGSGNKEFLALIERNIKTSINFIEICNKE